MHKSKIVTTRRICGDGGAKDEAGDRGLPGLGAGRRVSGGNDGAAIAQGRDWNCPVLDSLPAAAGRTDATGDASGEFGLE